MSTTGTLSLIPIVSNQDFIKTCKNVSEVLRGHKEGIEAIGKIRGCLLRFVAYKLGGSEVVERIHIMTGGKL